MTARSLVEVDLSAIANNVRMLCDRVAPAAVCAVVKADGYGHGAVATARVALASGAGLVAVANVEEARKLRVAEIDSPILLLSEPLPDEVASTVALRLTPFVYSVDVVSVLAEEVARTGSRPLPVHLKVDTGMHRVGVGVDGAADLARAIASRRELRLDGLATHLAVADDLDDPETPSQLARFDAVSSTLAAAGIAPETVHAANSAGAIAHPASRYGLVRAGIALYGIEPSPDVGELVELVPALRYETAVRWVGRVPSGSGVSYGLRHRFTRDSCVATLPVGYADGIPRSLGMAGADVLIGGVRRRMVGVVTMDQLMVDVTDGPEVAIGDEVVLIGSQGDERIRVEEWASAASTIGYEIATNLGRRARRRWIGGP